MATSIPTRTASVLIIEDNLDTAESLARFLRIGCGYHVEIATDGVKGLQTARSEQPDVVILDLGLPKKNGLIVGEQIAESMSPRPLIVAVTGYGDQATRDLAVEAGFDHFLTKPADPFDIEALIEAHLQANGWNRLTG
ncbi:MAG TPA: response regulator [Gemmataceae bacterium]|nr:response regulator [Gemmataceae bacterium]